MRGILVCLVVLGLVAVVCVIVFTATDLRGVPPARPADVPADAPAAPVDVTPAQSGAGEPAPVEVPVEPVVDEDVTAEPAEGSRIAGRVTDQAGAPIAGASIGLWAQQKPAGMFFGGSRGDPLVETTSAADGTYTLGPGTQGGVELVASHPSYAEEVTQLELAADEDLEGVDFQLLPGLSVSGSVVNEVDEPLVGAEVTVSSGGRASRNSRRFERSAPTNAAGEFLVQGMDPGTFSVRASHPGHHGSTWEQLQVEAGATDVRIVLQRGGIVRGVVMDPDGSSVAGARVVAGSGHETARLQDARFSPVSGPRAFADSGADGTFELLGTPVGEVDISASHEDFRPSVADQIVVSLDSPVTDIVLVLRPGLFIRGRVVDPAGAGVPGAEVLMSTTQRRDMGMSWSGYRPKTTTDERGEFIATGLTENDTYQFEARKDGCATRTEDMAVEFRPGAEDVLLHIEPGATIRGSVRDAAGAGVVCKLWLSRTDQHQFVRDPDTGADGAYEIGSLPAGTFRLACRQPEGYVPLDAIELSLVGGDVREGVDFVLTAGGTISGLVIDDGDQPVPGAMLHCMQMRPGGAVHLPMTTSAEDGTFSFTGVPEGDLRLGCTPPRGFPPRQQTIGQQQTVRAGEHVTVRLERGVTLTGTVVDDLGAPVTEFSLTTWKATDQSWNQKMPRGFSTTDGTFEMPGVPAEEERLDVTAAGFAAGQFPLAGLPSRGTHDCGTLTLTRGATLAGEVHGADGEPLAGARVSLAGLTGPPDSPRLGDTVGATETKADGSFRFEHVREGSHRVQATFTGLSTATEDLMLPATGELAGIVLRLGRGGVIRGMVTQTDGTPWVGAAVTCMGRGMPSATRGPPAPHTTDSAGAYAFEALPAGTYVVRLEAGLVSSQAGGGMRWMNSLEKRLELAADSELVCDFLGGDSCRVFGSVHGWSGLPASPSADCAADGRLGDVVHLNGDGGRVSTVIDEDGSFEMERVLPGGYELSIPGVVEMQVEVPAAAEHRLDVEAPTARISGRVRRGDGASPEGTVVRATRRGDGASEGASAAGVGRAGCALASGAFDLRTLEAGDYEVVASVAGVGASLPVTVTLAAGRHQAGVELVVDSGGSVLVTVTDAEGRPAPGARVSCQDASGRSLESAAVEAGTEVGTYRLTGIPPGTFRIWAGRGSLGNGCATGVAVSAGGETPASIVVGGGAIARVTVSRAGAPATDVECELLLDGRPAVDNSRRFPMASFWIGTSGTRELPMFPPGDYVLRVTEKNGSPYETPVTLRASGETVEVRVDLD